MIHVFADHIHAGTLEKEARKPHYVFTYQKRLLQFATNHCGIQHRQAVKILEEVKEGTRKAQKELEHGVKYLEGFHEIGQKISEQWGQGLLT